MESVSLVVDLRFDWEVPFIALAVKVVGGSSALPLTVITLRGLSGDPKITSSVIESVQQASTPGMTPLTVVFVGLILEGSMPILRTVS